MVGGREGLFVSDGLYDYALSASTWTHTNHSFLQYLKKILYTVIVFLELIFQLIYIYIATKKKVV